MILWANDPFEPTYVKCESCGFGYALDTELVSTCDGHFHCPNCGKLIEEQI